MGASASKDNLTQEVCQLKALVGELVQELSLSSKGVGFIPLARAAEGQALTSSTKVVLRLGPVASSGLVDDLFTRPR